MAGGDRLSDLPDDLLRRVLYFTPDKEAASTSALSRRWRSLWRSSGAVNLEARACKSTTLTGHDPSFCSSEFLCVAAAALAGAADPVSRLTFQMEASTSSISCFLYGVVSELFSLVVARLVEELRIAAVAVASRHSRVPFDLNGEVASSPTWWHWQGAFYELSLGSLPAETLRVLDLDLTHCRYLTSPPAVAFPRLTSLRLRLCAAQIGHLQRAIDASPELATVRLESVLLSAADQGDDDEAQVLRVSFPAATTLVLDWCGWTSQDPECPVADVDAVEIDAPRLRRFGYVGCLRQLSLSSPAPDLARVDLRLLDRRDEEEEGIGGRVSLWRFVESFSVAEELKLSGSFLEDMAVPREEEVAQLLCAFRNLKHLEMDGVSMSAAVAIANLLRCCPAKPKISISLKN